MPRVSSEPTIPAFERAETVHDLDSATGSLSGTSYKLRTHFYIYILTRCTNEGNKNPISLYKSDTYYKYYNYNRPLHYYPLCTALDVREIWRELHKTCTATASPETNEWP
jgi:hypothetical protein